MAQRNSTRYFSVGIKMLVGGLKVLICFCKHLFRIGYRRCMKELLIHQQRHWNLFLINVRPKRCVKDLFWKNLRHWNLFLINTRFNRLAKELLKDIQMPWNLFLWRAKRYVKEFFPKKLEYVSNQYITQEMRERSVDVCSYVLEYVFIQNKS